MAYSLIDLLLWTKKENAENTDCSFVFKVEGENGAAVEKTIHAHKLILSTVSPFFEANFKDEWKGNVPIPVTTFNYSVFEKVIRAIYLNEIEVESLAEALEIYKALHFYQIEILDSMICDKIQEICCAKKETQISQLISVANEMQDFRLKEFARQYFVNNTAKILNDPDFLKFTPETLNIFYQIKDLSATETDLLEALEKYIQENEVSTDILLPALQTIRFYALHNITVVNSTLITKNEKKYFLGKSFIPVDLSKKKNGRSVKSFFSKLSPKTQKELHEKLSDSTCWVCKEHHDMRVCSILFTKYQNVYRNLISKSRRFNEPKAFMDKQYHTNFEQYSEEEIIKILETFKSAAATHSEFKYFVNIDKELDDIKYV